MKNSASGPTYTVSPMPVVFKYASARFAVERGSRLYSSPVDGSTISQKMIIIGVAENGSTYTASRSGFRIMSDSLMAFQPSMDEPSNIRPSSNSSSPITPAHMVRCCHLPLGSVKRTSTHSISSSLIRLIMSLAEVPILLSFFGLSFLDILDFFIRRRYRVRRCGCAVRFRQG